MNTYSIALFFHIVGAIGFFVALGLEWMCIYQLRHARRVEQVHDWLRVSTWTRRAAGASMAVLLVAAAFMMSVWGEAAWPVVAVGAIVVMMVLSTAITGRRIAAIRKAATPENGPLSPDLDMLLVHPLLWVSMKVRLAVALGIVFLMVVKPDLAGSLLAVGLAALFGILFGLPVLLRSHTRREQTA